MDLNLEHGKIQTLEDIEDKQLEEGEGRLYSSKIQTWYFGIFIVYILFLIIGIRRTFGPLLVGGVLEAQFSLNFSIHLSLFFFSFFFFFLVSIENLGLIRQDTNFLGIFFFWKIKIYNR